MKINTATDGSDFYDSIYQQNPNKWSGSDRDVFAFKTIRDLCGHPKSIVDIGCGNGHTLMYFKTHWPEVEYVGFEWSPVAAGIAKKKGISVQIGSIVSDDIPGAEVGLMLGVFEHIRPLWLLRKILAACSYLYLEIPNCLTYAFSKDEGFRRDNGTQEEWHLKRETWEKLFGRCGAEIVLSLTGERPSWEFVWVLKAKQ